MASKFSGTNNYSSTFMVKHHGEVDALGGTAELRKLRGSASECARVCGARHDHPTFFLNR